MQEHKADGPPDLVQLAESLEDRWQWEGALAAWERALEAADGDERTLAECESGRARTLSALGRRKEADDADLAAKEHYDASGERALAVLCDASLAWRAAASNDGEDGLAGAMAARDAVLAMPDDPAAPLAAARACQIVGRLLFAAGRPEEGEHMYLEARDHFADAGDDRRLARCDAALALDLVGAGRLEDAEGRAEAAVAGLMMLDRAVDAAQVQLVVGRIQAQDERHDEARLNFAAARAAFVDHQLDAPAAEAAHLEALVASASGDDGAAVELLSTAIEGAQRADLSDGAAASHLERGIALDRLGRFTEAEADFAAAATALHEGGDAAGAARAIYGMAVTRRSRGDLVAAVETFNVTAEAFDAAGFAGAAAQARLDGAGVLEQLGRVDEALGWLERAGQGFVAEEEPVHVAVAVRAWGAAAGFAGRPEGLAAVAEARGVFAAHGVAWEVAECDDVAARLLGSVGRPAEAVPLAASAVEGFDAVGDAVAASSAGILLGRVLAESGRLEEAVGELERAIARAADAGIDPLAAQAHGSLADVLDAVGRGDEAPAHREAVARLAERPRR